MKIMVTGGAGFIASQIANAYLKDGHEIVVVDDLSTGRMENVDPKAKFYEIDICDPLILEVFEREKPDVLSHHAAIVDIPRSVADPLIDCEVNVKGFLNLLESGRKNGLKKVILASSGGAVYGDQTRFPADESHVTDPVSPYGVAKLASEKYLRFYNLQYDIDSVIFRYANVYGPRQSNLGEAGVVAIFINKLLTGKDPVINGDGGQTRDFVFVDDVVEANRCALFKNTKGVYNVGTGIETDVNSILDRLCGTVGAKNKGVHGPAKKGEQRRSCISYEKIKNEMGWSPKVSLNDGLKITTLWFEEQKG